MAGPLTARATFRSGRGRPRRRRGARFRDRLLAAAEVADAAPATALRPKGRCCERLRRCPDCPKSAARAVLPMLMLLCLLLRSSWLTLEGGPHGRRWSPASPKRTGRLAVSVSVGWWRSNSRLSAPRRRLPSSRVDVVVSRRRRDGSSSSAPVVSPPLTAVPVTGLMWLLAERQRDRQGAAATGVV
jgi:hypothetical protein